MWCSRSSSVNASQRPNAGEPWRTSISTSKISPRTQRTSFATPSPTCRCMPRTHPARRARVVVLDEVVGDAERRELVATPGLLEEAPRIAVDGRHEHEGVRKRGLVRLHPLRTIALSARGQSRRAARSLRSGSPAGSSRLRLDPAQRGERRRLRAEHRPARRRSQVELALLVGGPQPLDLALGLREHAGRDPPQHPAATPQREAHVELRDGQEGLGPARPERALETRRASSARDCSSEWVAATEAAAAAPRARAARWSSKTSRISRAAWPRSTSAQRASSG